MLISQNRETLSEKDIVQYGLFIKNTDKFVNKTVLLKDVRISNVNTEYLRSSGPDNSIEAVLKFQVMNISKKSVDNLKIRVIFANDGKVFDFRKNILLKNFLIQVLFLLKQNLLLSIMIEML